MSGNTPFSPVLPTVQLASSGSPTSVATGIKARTSQTESPTPQGAPTFPGGYTLRLTVRGSENMQVEFGTTSAVPTSAGSMALLGNTTTYVSVGESIATVAQISAATGSTLFITPGEGGI